MLGGVVLRDGYLACEPQAGRLAAAIKKGKAVSYAKPLFFSPFANARLQPGVDYQTASGRRSLVLQARGLEIVATRLEPSGGVGCLLMRMKAQACCKANGNITIAVFKKLVVIILSAIASANHEGGIRHKRKLVIVFQAYI